MKITFHAGRITLEREDVFKTLTVFASAKLLEALLMSYSSGEDLDSDIHKLLCNVWDDN